MPLCSTRGSVFFKQTNISVLQPSTVRSRSEVREAGLISDMLQVPGSVALRVYMTKFLHVFT
jgi:hypothetical protein